ncbi:hypothetical protein B5E80_09450 [Flavonifractor sp. An135]|nr:hypothetical protein [Flavonifractor sp. An135]OUQ23506.1 hypothetical protein B5E80_09450 [Flavonifractor sp. An135]
MYCVIDIGSNTIRLAVYRRDGGELRAILNNKRPAGLASYVDEKNCLSPEGVEKLIAVLREFQSILGMLPDCPVYPFATASLRNIVNTEQVLQQVKEETGLRIRVLSGYEEATLDYRGAVRSMEGGSGLMVDIGGGSTELVFFKEERILAAKSVPLGSLNLYSRFVSDLFPTKKELRAMEEEVRRTLLEALPPAEEYTGQPMVGVGGTARAALALYRNAEGGGEAAREYERAFLKKVLHQAEENPRKLLRRVLKIAPDRVHTLVPGVLILHTVAQVYGGHTILTSPYGVREGYLSQMLEREEEHYA